MRPFIFALAAALFVFAGAPAVRADSPVRHLEFRVSGHSTVTAQEESYDGLSTGMGTAGYEGTLSVDVVALANDGGMVVKVLESIHDEVRPRQAVTCAVYGDGRVICPPQAPISGAMHVLLSHLGRGWYDESIVDANGKWTRSDDDDQVAADSTFTVTPTKDQDVIFVREHTTIEPRKQIAVGFASDAEIRYNIKLSVPLSIHDVSTPDSRSSSGGVEITDITLTSDSFATKQ